MRLQAFIVELLFDHDCVIVPGFGGLVANYRSARLNRVSHLIHPPSKHVGFNRNLIQNDGLLANHISIALGINYKEAQSKIEEEVLEFKRTLATEGRLVWEKIGVFFNDKTGYLQFIPEDQENFLLESFGLTSIQLKPIAVELPIEEKEETVVAEIPEIVVERKGISPWKVAAAIAIPIGLAAAFLVGGRVSGNQLNFASLNPFSTELITTPYRMLAPSDREEVAITNESGFEKTLRDSSSAEILTYDFVRDEASTQGIRVVVNRKMIAPAESTATSKDTPVVVSPTSKPAFEVIGGAFMVEENATRLVAELKSKGYDAHMAGKRGALHLVAFGSYGTHADAAKALTEIKSKEGKGAWIKRN
jgi:cell division septation protein DedD